MLGYGSQGRAHALNLKDSGFDVVVGVRKSGDSWKKAKRDGLAVAEPVEAARGADVVAMLVPDLAQAELYQQIAPAAEERRHGAVRAWLQYSFQADQAAPAISMWC